MRLEIKPFPTQKQRKALKGLPQVSGVETNGDQAWVVHDAWPEKERSIADSVKALGFRVKGYDPSWGLEDRTKARMKAMKKAKKQGKPFFGRTNG